MCCVSQKTEEHYGVEENREITKKEHENEKEERRGS